MSREFLARKLRQSQVFGLTLDGEARGEGESGMRAVGAVIFNRVAWGKWGSTFRDVCLYPRQFSCWNMDEDANHVRLARMATLLRMGITPPELTLPLEIAEDIIAGAFEDATHGADHYCTHALLMTGRRPKWADPGKMTVTLGNHTFFRLRPVVPETPGRTIEAP